MKRTMNRSARTFLGTLPVLAGGILLAWSLHAKESAPKLTLKVDETAVSRNDRLPSSFAPVVKRVAPSVVKVVTRPVPSSMAVAMPRMAWMSGSSADSSAFPAIPADPVAWVGIFPCPRPKGSVPG